MNCAERIEKVFAGEFVDRVPFALKGWRVPHDEAEAALLRDGMCVIDSAGVYRTNSPNVRHESESYEQNGMTYTRTTVHTPKGVVSSLHSRAPSPKIEATTWREEYPFKTPDDYAAVEFMMCDRQYEPAYEGFLAAQAKSDGRAFFKTGAPGSPLHTIMYTLMGLDTFAAEWAERRDRVVALHDAMLDNERQVYPIIAESPAWVVQSGGNYTPEVLGKERLVEFVLPHWEELGDALHAGGKLLGSHLDANNALWADEVAASPLDWIEAFTPDPDSDMTLADARAKWPGKTLFINFPSSVHLRDVDAIEAETRRLLRESAPGDRFIIGITENVPENRWRESFAAILRTVNEFGRLPTG